MRTVFPRQREVVVRFFQHYDSEGRRNPNIGDVSRSGSLSTHALVPSSGALRHYSEGELAGARVLCYSSTYFLAVSLPAQRTVVVQRIMSSNVPSSSKPLWPRDPAVPKGWIVLFVNDLASLFFLSSRDALTDSFTGLLRIAAAADRCVVDDCYDDTEGVRRAAIVEFLRRIGVSLDDYKAKVSDCALSAARGEKTNMYLIPGYPPLCLDENGSVVFANSVTIPQEQLSDIVDLILLLKDRVAHTELHDPSSVVMTLVTRLNRTLPVDSADNLPLKLIVDKDPDGDYETHIVCISNRYATVLADDVVAFHKFLAGEQFSFYRGCLVTEVEDGVVCDGSDISEEVSNEPQ